LKFICPKCGYEKDLPIIKDIFYDIDDFQCSMCNSLLRQKDDTELKQLLEQIAEDTILTGMRHNIDTLGNNKTYELIESLFHKPEQRIRFRKFFFLAGGVMPNKEEEKI
jgi:hypothetical protein